MARTFGPIIATRTLALIKSGDAVCVELERPARRASGEYRCRFRIRGMGRPRLGRAFGEDSMQALMLAFEAMRQTLDPLASRLSCDGEPRQLGFYRFVPDIFGEPATRRIHAALDRAIRGESQTAIRRAKRARRRAAA
jgi:hypothetical protein